MSDKPAHMLEISDALARDVDKAKAGKLKHDLPIEAFMSEESIAEATRNTAAAAAPVHAEDLRMISRAEADARNTFDGHTLPRHAVPRRVIPEPYRRPRFDLDRHGRQWVTCAAETVVKGDMVAADGTSFRVASVEQVTRYETIAGVPDVAVGVKVLITGIAGNQVAFGLGQSVRAFRLAQ